MRRRLGSAVSKKVRTKKFQVSEEYHLFAVDCWWAGLLQGGLKEIVSIEWEALGNMEWRLLFNWVAVPNGPKLNVGHPEYVDMPTEVLDEILMEALDEFEETQREHGHLREKAEHWGLEEGVPDAAGRSSVTHRDDLDEAEKIIAVEYLWPAVKSLERELRRCITRMQELDRETRVRKEPDYFPVMIDRGMLRTAFVEQLGYDNEWLFDDVGEPRNAEDE